MGEYISISISSQKFPGIKATRRWRNRRAIRNTTIAGKVFLKAAFTFNTILIKIPTIFFIEIEKKLKSYGSTEQTDKQKSN